MIKIIYLLILVGLTSCYRENPLPVKNKTPLVVDDSTVDIVPSFEGQTWVIRQIRIGEFGMTNINDTLRFLTNVTYKYNNIKTNYSLYYTGNSFNLTMNGTPWGYLSGTIFSNNMLTGSIKGGKFVDITPGSSNKTYYYIWMDKIK